MRFLLSLLCSLPFIFPPGASAQTAQTRTLNGIVITQQGEALPGVDIRVVSETGGQEVTTVSVSAPPR